MVVRYEQRLKEMMAQAEVSPDAMRDLLARLETFVIPFCVGLPQPGMQRHAAQYMTGLLSDLNHKTAEGGPDGAGDHARGNGTFLTGVRLNKSATNVRAGTSIDQVYARQIGHLTRLSLIHI